MAREKCNALKTTLKVLTAGVASEVTTLPDTKKVTRMHVTFTVGTGPVSIGDASISGLGGAPLMAIGDSVIIEGNPEIFCFSATADTVSVLYEMAN